jgi:hypothetical protein
MAADEGGGRPLPLADLGVALLPPLAGVATWVFVTRRTGAAEAWDVDLYWPVTFGTLFVLGLVLAESRVPGVAFVIAGLLFLTHVVTVTFSEEQIGASFLALAIVFWPVLTAVGGFCALLGVRARRHGR